MTHADGAVRTDRLPLFFQLTNRVKSRLGLHRTRRIARKSSGAPARAGLFAPACLGVDAFVGASAIAI